MYIGRPQDMTYSLLRYEEETPVVNKMNSQVIKRASFVQICAISQCVVKVPYCEVKNILRQATLCRGP